MNRKPLIATLVAAAALLAGCAAPTQDAAVVGDDAAAAAAPTKIVLAIQPTDNADAISDKATELESFLEAQMKADGVNADVQILVPLTYVGVVEALRFGHAHAAMMGSWPAVLANQKAGAEIVLAEKRDVLHGDDAVVAPYYYSYYIVKKDSPYETIEDVRGKTVAYPSPTSGSGYIFPLARLVELGLVAQPAAGKTADPKEFFGNVLFAGGYAQAYEALKNGQADVAVTAGDINAQLYRDILADTRIIETQGPVPSHAVVYAKDFDGAAADALTDAFLDLKGEKKDLMRKLVSGIFVEFTETTTEAHVGSLDAALAKTGTAFSEKL